MKETNWPVIATMKIVKMNGSQGQCMKTKKAYFYITHSDSESSQHAGHTPSWIPITKLFFKKNAPVPGDKYHLHHTWNVSY